MGVKILYWTDFFLPHVGGIEIFSANLIPLLQNRGYEIIVVTSDSSSGIEKLETYSHIDIPVYRFPFWKALKKGNLKQLIEARTKVSQLKQDFQPDLVHIHFGATSLFHLQTINAHSANTLMTIHSLLPSSLCPQSLFQQMLNKTSWVNTVSDSRLAEIAKFAPQIAPRSSCIYYGLETTDLKINVPSFEPPQLLCLGRLVPKKGFDIAIKALASVVKQFPQIHLIIAGDGPEKTNLKNLATKLKLENSVEFLGWIEPEKVLSLLNKATIVLIPSRSEGLPLSALQAAQMTRPIIATTVDGLPEIVIDRQTGILVEKENIQQLVNAILFYLENPQKAIAFGQSAKERFHELFTMEACVDNYDALYKKLVNESS